jgi:hypothetical protein
VLRSPISGLRGGLYMGPHQAEAYGSAEEEEEAAGGRLGGRPRLGESATEGGVEPV